MMNINAGAAWINDDLCYFFSSLAMDSISLTWMDQMMTKAIEREKAEMIIPKGKRRNSIQVWF